MRRESTACEADLQEVCCPSTSCELNSGSMIHDTTSVAWSKPYDHLLYDYGGGDIRDI